MTTPRHRPARRFTALALTVLWITACGSAEQAKRDAEPSEPHPTTLHIDEARIDWPANPEIAAVRLEIDNPTDADDTLVAVSTPAAPKASVHRSTTDDEGLASMDPVTELPVPAGESVTFAPGGLHVMLTNIPEALEVGDDIEITFTFENEGDLTITVPVVKPGTTPNDATHHAN